MKIAILCFLALACCALRPRTEGSAPSINVILWFDTEDYILPRSDDAAKRIAEILTRLGVPGTFKVVGEKARVLEQRGRTDVIQALRKHEIGYHTDMHSRQPTLAVYLQHAGWVDGTAEFLRREGQGLHDVERIFGMPAVCFGQPGSSWAPQAYPALVQLGVPMYLDEAGHVGIDDQPFYYGGMLNIFNMRSTCTRLELGKADNFATATADFERACDVLRARGGGTISVYYHPCEFVHAEFWDGVNFSHGANPPRNEWKIPPIQPEPNIERNFADFERYVTFVRDKPGVRFSRASELLKRYADDTYTRTFSRAEVLELARATAGEIAFRRVGNTSLSGADAFSLLTSAALAIAEKRGIPDRLEGCPALRSRARLCPFRRTSTAFIGTMGGLRGRRRRHGRLLRQARQDPRRGMDRLQSDIASGLPGHLRGRRRTVGIRCGTAGESTCAAAVSRRKNTWRKIRPRCGTGLSSRTVSTPRTSWNSPASRRGP